MLYLNELDVDMGGEFVFIDAPGRQVKHMSSGKISKQKRELLMNQGAYVSDYENYQSDYDSDLIPPPSHVEVRKAVEREKRKLAHRSSYSDNRLDVGDMSKLIKSIPVTENGLNYTIVKSKVRRLLIFNSSAENIHAVTQMVNKNDRRFTLFMFLYDKAEDNM